MGKGRFRKVRKHYVEDHPGHVSLLGDVFAEFKRRYGESFNSLEDAEKAFAEFMVWWNTHKAKKV